MNTDTILVSVHNDARAGMRIYFEENWICELNQPFCPRGHSFLANGLVPEPFHQNRMQQIDALTDNTEADSHPHSNNGIVRDLVYPALYFYLKGVSITNNLETGPFT